MEKALYINSPNGFRGKTLEELRTDPEVFSRVLESVAPSLDALIVLQKVHWGLLLQLAQRDVPWFRDPPPVE